MCGIAGLMGLQRRPIDAEIVRRMCATLIHRGPDDEGLEQPSPHIALGHRRLSIIDIAGGHQPMCNEDRSVWVTFNGEIFNYRELRQELKSKGHRFETSSDTEVIVHLYEEHGTHCVERLNGQFAFALWDGERLFCARDPIGIKPLYYCAAGDHFAFASEPRAFFAIPGFDPSPDTNALLLYFRYHYIPSPHSAYEKISKLRPGERLTIERDGRLQLERYWDLASDPVEDLEDLAACRDALREKLGAAVERQMVADFPVGAFLSGGIDSSSIVSLMQRGSNDRIKTFTIGFPEKDERPEARAVASWVGVDHLDSLFDHGSAAGVLPDLLDQIDEPLGDSSLLATYAVSLLTRPHTKVALSGDGGDELHAGYDRHHRVVQSLRAPSLLRPAWSWLGRHLYTNPNPAGWHALDPRSDRRWPERILEELEDSRHSELCGPALREAASTRKADPIREEIERYAHLPALSQVLAVDMQTNLSDRLLAKVDRASMRASLEVRVPFLDIESVRFAFRLAPALRLHGRQTKGLLRDTMAGALPPSVFAGKKRGFGPPLKHWFAKELRGFVQERLCDSVAVKQGILSRRGLDSLLAGRRNGRIDGPGVWRVLVLETWLRASQERRFAPIPVDRHEAVSSMSSAP